MKTLILFFSLSVVSSVYALEGIYIPKIQAQRGEFFVTEGYQFKGQSIQLLSVSVSETGAVNVMPDSRSIGTKPSFIFDENYSFGRNIGSYSMECKTRFGQVTVADEDTLVLTRWSHKRTVLMGCPFRKSLQVRGERNGKLDVVTQVFRISGERVFVESFSQVPVELFPLK
jgi:hypothetical protein